MFSKTLTVFILSICICISQTSNSTDDEHSEDGHDYAKFKAHGCLMVIAWVLFASTGILLARYYRFLFDDEKFCGVHFWFFIHRPVMICVPIITLTALLVILFEFKWEWIEVDEPLNFAHSIFGIFAFGFACLQPFISLLRCKPEHQKRFIFNYVHRTLGLAAFVFAIVAIFTGTCMEDMNMGSNGWGVMLGWTIWLVLFVFISEILAFQTDKDESKVFLKLKYLMLILHLIVTVAFTTALLALIGTTSAPVE